MEALYHGKGSVSPGKNVKFWCRGGKKGGSIFELAALQNVRPSRFSMAWRMRAGTGQDLLVW